MEKPNLVSLNYGNGGGVKEGREMASSSTSLLFLCSQPHARAVDLKHGAWTEKGSRGRKGQGSTLMAVASTESQGLPFSKSPISKPTKSTGRRALLLAGLTPQWAFQAQAHIMLGSEQPSTDSFDVIGNLSIVGLGVLGILCWLEGRAKKSSELALQEAISNTKAKEGAFRSLKEELERNLVVEKENTTKRLTRVQEEASVLSRDLSAAKEMLQSLREKLAHQSSESQTLEKRAGKLQAELDEAGRRNGSLGEKLNEEKEKGKSLEDELKLGRSQIDAKELEIGRLTSSLQEKDKLFKDLSFEMKKGSEESILLQSQIKELEENMGMVDAVLKEKELEVMELNRVLPVAIVEGEETRRQLANVQEELDNLRMSSGIDIEMLKKSVASKEEEVEKLHMRLAETSKEVVKRNEMIAKMEEGRKDTKCKLLEQTRVAQKLMEELHVIFEELGASQIQVTSLLEEVEIAKELKENMEKQLAHLRNEAEENIRSLQQAISEEQAVVYQLNEEIKSTKQNLDSSMRQKSALQQEVGNLEASNENLSQELVLTRDTLKFTTTCLMEEKVLIATTLNQLESSRRTIHAAKETIKVLREDVGKVGGELEYSNKEVIVLSKELEHAEGKVATLEAEKLVLNEALCKERDLFKSLMEKASQADIVMTKLSKEKEVSQKRGKKLEWELANAKEEMTHLRKQLSIITDTALQEAKSRIKVIEENSQFKEQSKHAAEMRYKMESAEAEFSQLGEILERAEANEVEVKHVILVSSGDVQT